MKNPEWTNPAIELIDELIDQIKNGTDAAKIAERLANELRPMVVALAANDPRD